MKSTPRLKNFLSKMTLALVAAVLFHSRPDAPAQSNPEPPNRRQPPASADRRGDRPQPRFQPGRALPMLDRVLSEEQRKSLHTAMESQRQQMRSLEGIIREARQALMKASLAERFDEDAVRAKAMEVAKLDAELIVLRARAMSKVQPPFSKEQIDRISNPPPPREMDGPPDDPRPGPRRNIRPPPGSRDLPVAPKPESQ